MYSSKFALLSKFDYLNSITKHSEEQLFTQNTTYTYWISTGYSCVLKSISQNTPCTCTHTYVTHANAPLSLHCMLNILIHCKSFSQGTGQLPECTGSQPTVKTLHFLCTNTIYSKKLFQLSTYQTHPFKGLDLQLSYLDTTNSE